jgi:hypothetical protein
MKTFIALLVIMTASVFSQGWNTVVQTTIPFSSASKVDLTTNRDGNHILLTYAAHPTYYLRYYLVNSSGSVVRNYTFETQAVQFANIDGTNDRIYVVYKLGNQIKTRKSTNAGLSWSNIFDINIGNNTCNHLDITFGKDDNALHVVWATQDNGNDYETYYRRLPSSDQWETQKNVTDYGNEVGGFPTVSKSLNRVHVSYNTGQGWDPETNLGDAKSRDKYINTWQTPQLVFSPESFRERIHAGSSMLFDFFYKLETGMGQYHADLYVKVRNFGNTSWSSPQLLQQFSGVREIVSAANTVDGITHIVYEIFDGVGYRNYNGSSWSAEEPIGSGYISPRIYAVSNDLFVAWGKDAPAQNKFIHYRQYDANPLTPQGLTVSIYTLGTNTYPKLNWNLNTEPDVYNQTNAYQIERRIRLWDGPWSQWAFLAYRNGNQSEFIDYSIGGLHNEAHTAEYRISAKDVNNHFSDYSSSVSINFSKFNKTNNGLVKYDFELDQNYPNPFNPITTINYSIKSTGLVTLKVYDMLGIEVASIVNEIKEAGNYSVTFNASELPSGIYFYTLKSGNFTETKKLILLK